ncbi:MAG TPA: hypothetical protein VGV59_09585 [Pyrinomonadaceae bacterium]|nr:hypothetical protein [Pyrinomonadaceae bacterium]
MTEERIVAYLLEELPEEELQRFEDECLSQESWPVEISLVEEDLIDDYLRGRLTPEQRLHFERNYLVTSARMERVRHAAALLRHVDQHQPVPSTEADARPNETWVGRLRALFATRRWALAVAVALVIMVVLPVAWWVFRERTFTPRTIATLTLSAGRSDRAGGTQPGRISLTDETDALKISLTLPEAPARAVNYRVRLEDDIGQVKTAEITGHDARSVSVLIPASQLNRGAYVLNLSAVETDGTERRIGNYFFNVE